MLGQRLGDRTHLCADVVGLFLALHGLCLQHILALAQVMVSEYSRNHESGRQARELTKEKRGESPPCIKGLEHHDGLLCQNRVGHWEAAHAKART